MPVSNRLQLTPEPNASFLRHAILYWDKIDFPQNNRMRVEFKTINFLEKEGIAQRTQIHTNGGEIAVIYANTQLDAF